MEPKTVNLISYSRKEQFEYDIRAALKCSHTYARKVIVEYIRFMKIKAVAGIIWPCPDIETVWRIHIMYTQDYVQFCDDLIGEYIHYDIMEAEQINVEDAMDIYYGVFGEYPDNDVWKYLKKGFWGRRIVKHTFNNSRYTRNNHEYFMQLHGHMHPIVVDFYYEDADFGQFMAPTYYGTDCESPDCFVDDNSDIHSFTQERADMIYNIVKSHDEFRSTHVNHTQEVYNENGQTADREPSYDGCSGSSSCDE